MQFPQIQGPCRGKTMGLTTWYFSLLAQRKVPQKKVHHESRLLRDAAEPARAWPSPQAGQRAFPALRRAVRGRPPALASGKTAGLQLDEIFADQIHLF
jgi:hypothetical protein